MSDPISSTIEARDSSPGRYTVIARRYRPQGFEELVGQEHVAKALQQAITSDRVGHAYLFTGARGVGKTSAARILAKALNCVTGPTPTPCNVCDVCQRVATGDDVDVVEIDGASNRGIDEIRQLRQNAAVRPSRVRYKIYIIDEVHMLTKEAFNALLKTLEEPPDHVKFIFATTEAQKIPITILSRCQRFDFAGISTSSIQERLAQIAAAEGVAVDTEALQILASRAAGSMRDSQSLLEQLLAVGHQQITAADVNELLGIAPAERLSELAIDLANRDTPAALAKLDATIQSGVDVGLLLDQLIGYFRDVMALAVGCKADQMLYALPSQSGEVAVIGQRLGLPATLAIGQILDQASSRMRVSVHGRTLVEMALVRICQLGELEDLASVIAELRGAPTESPAAQSLPREVGRGTNSTTTPPPAPAKKNDEPVAMPSLASGLKDAVAAAIANGPARITPAPAPINTISQHAAPLKIEPTTSTAPPVQESRAAATQPEVAQSANDLLAESSDTNGAEAPPGESVLAQFKRAMAEGVTPRTESQPARPSQREQTAQIAERPFVRRAMEVFDVQPNQLKYTLPKSEAG